MLVSRPVDSSAPESWGVADTEAIFLHRAEPCHEAAALALKPKAKQLSGRPGDHLQSDGCG